MPRLSKIGAAALAAFGWTGLSSVTANYLVVAGGGGGGGYFAGGGGAGGYQSGTTSLNPTLSYTVTVGGGGAGGDASGTVGVNGSNSQFGTLTASVGGGGGGASFVGSGGVYAGQNGGSGGGAGLTNTSGVSGGSATSGQGSAGGSTTIYGGTANYGCSGGGGAGGAGSNGNGSSSTGGNGGSSSTWAVNSVAYAGGGGGAGSVTPGSGGTGGGTGGTNSGTPAGPTAGTANLGGGGGGAGQGPGARVGGQGGSGVVVISYPAPQQFGGGVVTTSGSNVIHTFNTSGTLSPLSSLTASYLIVAGGGAGGVGYGGGGGAGGMLTGSGVTIDTNSNYVVTVGAGGAAGIGGSGVITTYPSNGSNSVLSIVSTTAVGGGRGGTSGTAASNGGSGGGASPGNLTTGTNGTGTAGQGTNGGTAQAGAGFYGAAGGGGAGAVGGNSTNTVAGNGGIGSVSSISGASVTYAAGGGGGTYSAGTVGTGGSGIGGSGNLTGTATSGTVSTGSGGGGSTQTTPGFNYDSGAGGSGIVIISYAGSTQQMAGGTVTITGGNVIHTFTSSGYLTPIKYVNNSLRFRQSASAYLNRTASNAPTSNQKGTFSFWFKRGSLATGSEQWLFAGGSNSMGCGLPTNNVMFIEYFGALYLYTTQVFRDPSAWYHMTFAIDTTQATAANRAKLYINGVQVTSFTTEQYPSQNATFNWMASGQACYINQIYSGGRYFDGYMAEFNYIDGQALTPNSFGTFNSYGVWQPITYGGSYGTNGFYLPFTNKTSTTTLGYDFSPNGNNWTTNNISLTAGSTYDSMTDVPTLTSATAANYAVMNPLDKDSTITASDGNLYVSRAAGAYAAIRGSIMFPTSGKYYAEATVVTTTASGVSASFGFSTDTAVLNNGAVTGQYILYGAGSGASAIYSNGSSLGSLGVAFSAGDVLQVAFDGATGKAWVGRNNVWYNATAGTTGDPANGTNNTFSLSGLNIFPVAVLLNDGLYFNAGQRPFSYTPPTGFVALNTYNLPASTITNGAAYMAATTYTGTGATQTISNSVNGISFQPDWVWTKARSAAIAGLVYDSVRGATKYLQTNSASAEGTGADSLTAFASNGFTVGADTSTTGVNQNTTTYVGWQWKAGGTSSSNTAGTITSSVSVGATQGFSVVQFTATGSNATVGHGLGVAPAMVIVKDAASVGNWAMYHQSLPSAAYYLYMNTTAAQGNTAQIWNSTAPTSTVFSVGTWHTADRQIAYCFAAVKGFSAFGSYTGNGSTDGPFCYTGFQPRYLLIKRTDAANNWVIQDTSRSPYNVSQNNLYADTSGAEASYAAELTDILSNGFKQRGTGVSMNASGGTYIYAAFASNPLKFSNAR